MMIAAVKLMHFFIKKNLDHMVQRKVKDQTCQVMRCVKKHISSMLQKLSRHQSAA